MESEIILFKMIIKKLVHIHIHKLNNLQANLVRSIEFSKIFGLEHLNFVETVYSMSPLKQNVCYIS